MEYYVREKLGWHKLRVDKYAIFCIFEIVPEYASVSVNNCPTRCDYI